MFVLGVSRLRASEVSLCVFGVTAVTFTNTSVGRDGSSSLLLPQQLNLRGMFLFVVNIFGALLHLNLFFLMRKLLKRS